MSTQATVIVVDDEQRILNTIARVLKPHYNVLTTQHGAEALDMLRQQRVHVILSDQRMPGMTGVELLAKAKRIAPNTTRVLLTGYSDLPAIESAINDGEIFRYINKPWKNDDLLSTIAQSAGIARQLYDTSPSSVLVSGNESLLPEEMDMPSILVLDAMGELPDKVNQLFADRVEVLVAKDARRALKYIKHHHVGVILANLSCSNRMAELAFLKTIKSMQPQVLTLVLAHAPDSELMVNLINEGQIYRYLVRPLRVGTLKMYLLSALRYHQRLQSQPQQTLRHQVAEISDPDERKFAKGLRDAARSVGRLLGLNRS